MPAECQESDVHMLLECLCEAVGEMGYATTKGVGRADENYT